ncbi:putative ribonuclease H-like domain-containing protein [Tanacetum coccineum]
MHALVDGKKIVITVSSVRRDPQFADEDGTDCLPTTTIFENLKLMRYDNLSDKLTFFKSYFSHQWKFLVHTILQCLSPKKTAWNEFSSNIASAIICLTTNQKFNFSKMVFDGMTRNLDSLSAKFLMYLTFLQVFLDKQLDKTYKPRKPKKKVTQIPQSSEPIDLIADEVVLKERGDNLERAANTASSLEVEQVVVPGKFLFCDWVNHRAGGVKRNTLGYTLVDLNNLGHKVDPFILASQA